MSTYLQNAVANFFKEKRFSEAVLVAEMILQKSPGDISAYYCVALAYVLSNDYAKGLPYFSEMVKSYDEERSRQEMPVEVKLFVGRAGLQLAQLADFYAATAPLTEMYAYSRQGARIAREIGEELKDTQLRDDAQNILDRHLCLRTRLGKEIGYAKPSSPFILQIEPTNTCNMSCTMCPYVKMTRKKGFIDTGLVRQIMNGWGNRSVEFPIINLLTGSTHSFARPGAVKLFFMGEPLLHPRLDELISIIRGAKSNVGIQTNGILLKDPQIRKKLLESGPSSIGLSLDGIDARTYEQIRKGNSWQLMYSGLEALYHDRKTLGLTGTVSIGLATIVSDYKEETMARAHQFLSPLKPFVDDIQFLPLDRRYEGDFVNPAGEVSAYEQGYSNSISADEPVCSEALKKLNVLWDGTVTPCCFDIDAAIKLGEASGGIDAVWNNDKTTKLHCALLAHTLDDFSLCRSCIGTTAVIDGKREP